MRRLSILVFGLLFVSQGYAADRIVDFDFNTSEPLVQLNQTFEVSLQLKIASETTAFALSQVEIPGLSNFQVLKNESAKSFQSINNQVAIVSELKYVLQPKRVGNYRLGPIKLNFKDEKGKPNNLIAEAIDIKVIEAIVIPTSEPEPPEKAIIIESKITQAGTSITVPNTNFWWQIGGASVVLFSLLILAGIRLHKKIQTAHQMQRQPLSGQLSTPSVKDLDFWNQAEQWIQHKVYQDDVPAVITGTEIIIQAKKALSSEQYDLIRKAVEQIQQHKFSANTADADTLHSILESLTETAS